MSSRAKTASETAAIAIADRPVDFHAPQHFSPQEVLHPGRAPRSEVLGVGVVGYGYWGPNVVRNFHAQESSRVLMVCDRRPDALMKVARAYPEIEIVNDLETVLHSPDID